VGLVLGTLGLLPGAMPAAARPVGPGLQRATGSAAQPDAETGEGKPTITTPAAQRSIIGTAVSFKGSGAEMVAITTEGLPEGLTAKITSLSEWTVTGTPTKITPTKLVKVTVENKGGKEKAEASFDWTVDGITNPGSQTAVVGGVVAVPVSGVGLAELAPATALPEGLGLEKVSETEWEIRGTPAAPGLSEVELTGANSGKEALPPIQFTFTVDGIDAPGEQQTIAGEPFSLIVKGVGMKALSAPSDSLPAGLELKDVGTSETEWEIVGRTALSGSYNVRLEGQNAKGETLAPVEFTLDAAAKVAPPAPPTASGQLSISPAAAFSAARSSCGGAGFSTGTVTTQWLLDGAPIAGATSPTYIAPRIDDGQSLSCRQTATGADGASTSLTSPGLTIHEQPPQPAWPIGPASEHCATALCMEDGPSAQTPTTRTYQQGGSWLAPSQVRCISAPWTSIAGNSALAAVEPFAEAHTVSVTLQRVTAAGIVTLASEQLSGLGTAADELDGTLAHSPFAGQIVAGYGAEPFTAGELWPRLEPGSLGRPDRFAAGQGYIAYQLAATPGVRRSFQLLYNLTSADLGARLRCIVAAEDGPLGAPTRATLTSPEYAVAKSPSCAPREITHVGGPQPAAVLIGSRRCLSAQAGLPEIGGALSDVSSVAGRSDFALECALAGGCSGRLSLASAGHRLASVAVSLRQGSRRVLSLKLDGQGRSRLRRAGRAGLPVTLTLAGGGSSRLLLAARLLNLT
jgi:hypothetical protein